VLSLFPHTLARLRLRDAVNQVSYEYIACQQARQGVMILSEFAGAAQSLNGSIVVNPWDSQQVADAIHEAVTMPAEVRAENHRKLFKYVNKYSAAFWGTSFVREMLKIAPGSEGLVLGDKAGQGVLLPGSAGGSRLPASSPPVEIDRSEIAA
jgi:trehalose 6-phosphate synthase